MRRENSTFCMFSIQNANFHEGVAQDKSAIMPLYFWFQTVIDQGFQMRHYTIFVFVREMVKNVDVLSLTNGNSKTPCAHCGIKLRNTSFPSPDQ